MRQGISDIEPARAALPAGAHLKYRPDIDGLRAVAVLAVVGYHAFPASITGGMVGVDIFFVISGYLISSIIIRELQQGRFSFLEFYSRRVKRIFPALATVLVACLVFGWFALYDGEYRALGRQVAGGAAFVLNFLLAKESGYFDLEAQYKVLLHLWSLGIEEQFYLIWPLLLFVLWKRTHTVLPLIVSLLVASLLFNVWLVNRQPAEAFYWPFTRFWELMLGSVIAYAAQPHGKTQDPRPAYRRIAPEVFAWLGLLLIAVALCVINDRSKFPGWLALLPTAGAGFIIAAGPTALINRLILASRPMVFVGLISYPLYLWHWPILALDRLVHSDMLGRGNRMLAVALSFLLAWLTYRAIERPLRFSRKALTAVALCAVVAVVGAFGLIIYQQDGLPNRAANLRNIEGRTRLAQSVALDTDIRTRQYPAESCESLAIDAIAKSNCVMYGAPTAETIVVWGDSQAGAWAPVFYKIAQQKHLRVIRFYIGGCPPLVETRRKDVAGESLPCASFGAAEHVMAAIADLKPKHIFLIGFWSLYTSGKIEAQHAEQSPGADLTANVLATQLGKTLRRLPSGTPVTIFRSAPMLLAEPERGMLRGVRIEPTAEENRQREAFANLAVDAASTGMANATIFDPSPLLCRDKCQAVVDGSLIYINWGHLAAQGALLYYDTLLQQYFGGASEF